jgi:transcriptional regulator with XRE-family HTH domain
VTKAEFPGQELRELRRQRGLTLKVVEIRSRAIAESEGNTEYIFTAGRLSQVENSTSLPSLYKLATLSQVYGVSYDELLRIYGVTPNGNGSGVTQEPPDLATPAPVWV